MSTQIPFESEAMLLMLNSSKSSSLEVVDIRMHYIGLWMLTEVLNIMSSSQGTIDGKYYGFLSLYLSSLC